MMPLIHPPTLLPYEEHKRRQLLLFVAEAHGGGLAIGDCRSICFNESLRSLRMERKSKWRLQDFRGAEESRSIERMRARSFADSGQDGPRHLRLILERGWPRNGNDFSGSRIIKGRRVKNIFPKRCEEFPQSLFAVFCVCNCCPQ